MGSDSRSKETDRIERRGFFKKIGAIATLGSVASLLGSEKSSAAENKWNSADSFSPSDLKVSMSAGSMPFLGEIAIVAFNFAPKNWALCNGQLLPINQNQALFSLLGTTYGGDGRVNFALPNLRGRSFIHSGFSYTLGSQGGERIHTLTTSEMPQHVHSFGTSNYGTSDSPVGMVPARHPSGVNIYGGSVNSAMAAQNIINQGGSQPHENMPPYLVLNFIISLFGVFPSQS